MDESALYMTGKGHRKSEDNVNPLFGVKFSRNYFPISYLNCKIPPPNSHQRSVNFQLTLNVKSGEKIYIDNTKATFRNR